MKNYYEILEVHESSSLEVIQRVYKLLAKKYHPDLQDESSKKEAEEKFKEIAEAYEILSNEEKRKAYDEELQASRTPKTPPSSSQAAQVHQKSEPQNNINHEAVNQAYQQAQHRAYEDAMKKAYHDAYVNNLKRFGYKVKYKETFKQKFKKFITLVLTIIVLSIIAYVAWNTPAIREILVDTFTF